MSQTDDLLRRVVERINNGLDFVVYGDEGGVAMIEATWRRDYGEEGESDPRPIAQGNTFAEVLNFILKYEDEADAADAAEGL